MGSIVLLSGPVGAGKTSVARELVASSPGTCVYIEGDIFWSFIVKTTAHQEKRQTFGVIMRAMTLAAVPFARAGYEVIVDFSIPPEFLEFARVRVKETPLSYVVLLPSETTCSTRAGAREEGTIADYTPYHELYLSFDPSANYAVRDDDSNAAELAARIRKGLKAGVFLIS